jgi:hypothetical protein
MMRELAVESTSAMYKKEVAKKAMQPGVGRAKLYSRRQQDSNLRSQRETDDQLCMILICRRNHLAIAP